MSAPSPHPAAPVTSDDNGPSANATVHRPRQGSSLWFALRMAPASRQPILAHWLGWWHEVSRIPLDVRDPSVAEAKLGWWHQELSESAQGRPRHPLMREWLTLTSTDPHQAPWPWWQQQLEGLGQLTHQTRWMDDASLQKHAQQTTGMACAVAAHLLGARSEAATEAASLLGQGLRQAHLMARLGQDARAGWVMVGIDWLQAHDVRAHLLGKPQTPMSPGWGNLLTAMHVRARETLQQALTAVRALPSAERKAMKPLVYLAHASLALIDAVNASGDTVLHQRIMLTPLRKSWMAQQVRWGWLR